MTERRNHRWFWLQLTIGAVRLHPHSEPGGTGTSTGLSVWLYLDMSSWKISEAIRGNQRYLAASSRQSASMAVQPLSTPAKRPRHTHAMSSPKATMRNAVTSAMTRKAR